MFLSAHFTDRANLSLHGLSQSTQHVSEGEEGKQGTDEAAARDGFRSRAKRRLCFGDHDGSDHSGQPESEVVLELAAHAADKCARV